ncbi:PREDICTED: uncharacterized protein LOC105360018 [Ceratosolen solmsi marchali]|uniref:Uncharacterized protein LOC105360018 n=1 Tax=Ceratosolen solmsi marchali TaxID=326594 RepID=A0AAJ6VL90_9HYME|nr:PREDICTED: uncharacterized protein LOC105360018 [Ceratosolen solmsi marchali]
MEKFLSKEASSSISFKKTSKVSAESVESDKKRKKKEKSLRRFIPAIFTKDNQKENLEKVELGERKKHNDRYYTHYQQNGRLNRCSDPLYLNNDGKTHVKLNPSLSGSIIEERLNEIKHDLFPTPGNMSTTTPDHFLISENVRTKPLHQQKHTAPNGFLDVPYNSLSIDVRGQENKWIVDGNIISASPDMRNLKQRKSQTDESIKQCVLKRKYSFQESMISPFRRNCGASGRVSAPPNERFLIRPRAIHPIDRPLPAIPQKIMTTSDYCNISPNNKPSNTQTVVIEIQKENSQNAQDLNRDASNKLMEKEDIECNTEISNTINNFHRPLNFQSSEANLRCSSSASLKSGDYADSSYTANSSQKSELSPTSSKSGEYYLLNSPHASNQTSSTDSLTDLRVQEIPQSIKVEINELDFACDKLSQINQFTKTQEKNEQKSQDLYQSEKSGFVYDGITSEIKKDITAYVTKTCNQLDKKGTEEQNLLDLKNYDQQLEQKVHQNKNKLSLTKKKQEQSMHNNTLSNLPNSNENVLTKNKLQQDNCQDTKLATSQTQITDKKSCHTKESQPNDQVLIASPQRDDTSMYSAQSSSYQSDLNHSVSSVNDNAKKKNCTDNALAISSNTHNSPDTLRIVKRQQPSSPGKNNQRRPEPIYIYNSPSSTPSPSLSNTDQINYSNINQSCKNDISAQIHSSDSYNETQFSNEQTKIDSQKKRNTLETNRQVPPESKKKTDFSINSGQQSLSPQKKKMMQHLEAYYWHQKAIDAQRKSVIGMNSLEVKEYAYWKQIQGINRERSMINQEYNRKMLFQSQQIYCNGRVEYGSLPEAERQTQIENFERQCMYQKEQRQPILVVRPQPCPRNNSSLQANCAINSNAQQPFPIYRRVSQANNNGNMIIADYGNMGPKRVSFSNQNNVTKIGPGQWPTKHGPAPEPPTRKKKIEPSSHYDTPCTNVLPCDKQELAKYDEYDANRPLPAPPNHSSSPSSWLPMKRYSIPKGQQRNSKYQVIQNRLPRHSINDDDTDHKFLPTFSESESGSEAGEVQRILQQRQNEEEWNADGKNRYSNESGGTGKAEGEGPNDHPGRRIGGVDIGIGGGAALGTQGRTGGVGGGRSRDELRRHTLSGDHQPNALLHHQQFNAVVGAASGQTIHPLHPRHLPPPHSQYGPSARHTTMDLEMGTKSRQRKSPLPRGYPPPSSAMLFDDDPGIMSEVETSSTGFRRGGKQRSSLPVVRTPSKTLERPLGLVFLQYRNETKRALLPNEITSIDTVKALFVRSFPKQLTMEYLDSPHVKIYIHDSNKDMFYELEDLRSHLRDIRDRSVLRLFESDGVAGMPGTLRVPGGPMLPSHWEDPSYFSEPEFDSEFQHQHIHKSKSAKSASASTGYYMSGSSTLPRGGALLRPYSPATTVLPGPNGTAVPGQPKTIGTPGGGGGQAPAKPLRNYHCGKSPLGSLGSSTRFSRDSSVSLYSIPDPLHGESGYISSPERGGAGGIVPAPVGNTGNGSTPGSTTSNRYPPGPYSASSSYEDPYYSQYSGTVTPVIDEEASSDTELLDESYSLYGVKPPGRPPSGPPRSPFATGGPALLPSGQPYDATRIRVEHMERQLANLTGLVQKALTHAPHPSPSPRDYLQVPAGRDTYVRNTDDNYLRTDVKPPKLGKDKSVSFEKSVSFSDEPPDMNSPKQHSPQHTADSKPTKPAIKSSTLPRMSSQERERHKPTPPPKPVALATGQYVYRDLALTPEMYNQLRGLQKKAKDLRQEIRNLRRMSQAQAHTVRETIRDTFITIRATLLSSGDNAWANDDAEKLRLSREEDLYKQEMLWLEKDLTGLESTVEELRGNVINRKTRVNMSDVENMALILNKASQTVADLKVRFPNLQEGMKGLLSSEMEKVMRKEKFLNEEPDRLESDLKRCKKLTGTLVTLKRLASVQEQRLPNSTGSADGDEATLITPTTAQFSKATTPVPAERAPLGSSAFISGGSRESTESSHSTGGHTQRPENALDALLDELQTFSRPSSQLSQVANVPDVGRKSSIDPNPGQPAQRRLHSCPGEGESEADGPITDELPITPPKPPLPERNAELLQLASTRRAPPPPPPRTSSRSPLASPTSPQLPPRAPLRRGLPLVKAASESNARPGPGASPAPGPGPLSTSNSSSCESVNSQEGLQNKRGRHEQLEQRHQELLRKQKALQEQYARLQQLQRNASSCTTNAPPAPPDLLKKTGSESNLLAKMGLGLTAAASSGSLSNLTAPATDATTITAGKLYETDIL